jgi:hypothetical protein
MTGSPERALIERLYSVEMGSSAQTVAKMLRVLFPDATTALDMTYGSGNFWKGAPSFSVVGIDIDPDRARDVCADFTQLPFAADTFDVAIFDPPYLADVSVKNPGIVGRRFGSYARQVHVHAAVRRGMREAWRVARIGVIVKVQIHTHASLLVDMEGWVRESIGAPLYGRVEQVRPVKLTDPKWTDQLSVWSNSATFLAYRKGDQRHIRRQPAALLEAI